MQISPSEQVINQIPMVKECEEKPENSVKTLKKEVKALRKQVESFSDVLKQWQEYFHEVSIPEEAFKIGVGGGLQTVWLSPGSTAYAKWGGKHYVIRQEHKDWQELVTQVEA